MGRVRRYKKLKACDPFAKKKPTVEKKRPMDLAPEESEVQLSGKALRRRERRWAREALGLDDDAVDFAPPPKVVFEPRQRNESERQFRRRLKAEGSKIMKEAVEANSATKQRRKENLKKRAQAKKKKPRDDDDDLLPPKPPDVAFGERVDAPPQLQAPRRPQREARAPPKESDVRSKPPPKGAPAKSSPKERYAQARREFAPSSILSSWERGH